ncbi:MAG: hypothetical protein ACLFV5_07075 [Anaerolineales bacterium]
MTWEKSTLGDFMGDFVVYRNLEPMDPRLDGLHQVWDEIGLDHYYVPRKTTPEYAMALLHYVQAAQAVRGISSPVERLLFIGDTLMNDGTAARNLGRHLPMMGFIGADRLQEPQSVEIEDGLMVANRWAALADFVEWVENADFPCDQATALLIDLDKTSLGARGRNDHVINDARVEAVKRTMRGALGDDFDEAAFRAVYDPLNDQKYHHFTADNQDYLAYICLMVNGGVYTPDELWSALEDGTFDDIEDFVAACETRRERMSPALEEAHAEVLRGIEAEDPTPFKAFRRGEYFETVARMDVLPDDAPADQVLDSEIVLTAEVAQVAGALSALGVLVFGISDKPDEASVPTAADAAGGYRPIHHTPMKVYGEKVV